MVSKVAHIEEVDNRTIAVDSTKLKVKVSSVEGNALTVKDDGLHVTVPKSQGFDCESISQLPVKTWKPDTYILAKQGDECIRLETVDGRIKGNKADQFPLTELTPKVDVEDPNSLTEDEKSRVKQRVQAQLDQAGNVTVTVDSNGTVTVEFDDGSSSTLGQSQTVSQLPHNDEDLYRLVERKMLAFADSGFTQQPDFTDEETLRLVRRQRSMHHLFSGWDSLSNPHKVVLQSNFSKFKSAITKWNSPLTGWDTPNVTDMRGMFDSASAFNQSVSNFDTSNVVTMRSMFSEASNFNQSVSNFNTSNVTDMEGMFSGASNFNQSVSNFDTSNVADMGQMFYNASSFNQSVSNFDTRKVTTMYGMFYNASSFNQDVSNFGTSSVTTMYGMFYNASSFNQDLTHLRDGVPQSRRSSINVYAMLTGSPAKSQKSLFHEFRNYAQIV